MSDFTFSFDLKPLEKNIVTYTKKVNSALAGVVQQVALRKKNAFSKFDEVEAVPVNLTSSASIVISGPDLENKLAADNSISDALINELATLQNDMITATRDALKELK